LEVKGPKLKNGVSGKPKIESQSSSSSEKSDKRKKPSNPLARTAGAKVKGEAKGEFFPSPPM